jgi:hypothetical protein
MKLKIRYYIGLLSLSLLSLGQLTCARPGESGIENKAGTPASAESSDVAPSPQSSDASAQPSGGIEFSLAEASNFQDLRIKVVGQEDRYQLRAIAQKPGSFEITPALTGRHDLMIFAESKPQGTAPKVSYGFRLSGIEIPNDRVLSLTNVQLNPTFSISGKVLLQSGGNPRPEVSIKGTSIKATADAEGNFVLAQVPAGNHEFVFTASGYHSGSLSRSFYASSTSLPTLMLFLDSKDLGEGIQYLGNPIAKDIAVRVTCALKAPGEDYDSMRIGLSSDLEASNWQALRSSVDLNLKEQVRTVYVQFSREGRQPSRVYSTTIPSP